MSKDSAGICKFYTSPGRSCNVFVELQFC